MLRCMAGEIQNVVSFRAVGGKNLQVNITKIPPLKRLNVHIKASK